MRQEYDVPLTKMALFLPHSLAGPLCALCGFLFALMCIPPTLIVNNSVFKKNVPIFHVLTRRPGMGTMVLWVYDRFLTGSKSFHRIAAESWPRRAHNPLEWCVFRYSAAAQGNLLKRNPYAWRSS
jgi:hypothetical protein